MSIAIAPSKLLNAVEIREQILEKVDGAQFATQRVLLIVPDTTRSGPLATVFRALHEAIQPYAASLDVIIALGTHPPLSQERIREHLGISSDPEKRYSKMKLMNHEWDNPAALETIGWIEESDAAEISGGLLRERVPVKINKKIFEYDCLLVAGPVFPHEVVGYSGGNKYFFPGISGPEVLDFFHWLGALITNAAIIGFKNTRVRDVVNRAASMVPVERRCLAYVAGLGQTAHGVCYGTPEEAWDEAADISSQVHVKYVEKPYKAILSCAPKMYDDLWVGGKCMYKMEPVVADGGELIIHAPHITEVSKSHGKHIEAHGYHVCEYFTKQWDKFKDVPRGVLAHLTHVRGTGTYDNGVEKPRIKVTLATSIPEALTRKINFDYRDWRSINFDDWRNRENEGILFVEKAGEILYRLKG